MVAGAAGSAGFAPKLNPPDGAEEAASFFSAPNVKAGAALEEAAAGASFAPNEKVAGPLTGAAGSSSGLRFSPKSSVVGGPVGVVVPELAAEDLPKKSGIPLGASSRAGSVEAVAAAGALEGLPMPSPPADFLDPIPASFPPIPANRFAGAEGVEVPDAEAEPPIGKKPKPLDVATGGSAGVGASDEGFLVVGGESGAAMMLGAEASGDEARGRLALSRERGPAPGRGPDGTDKPPAEPEADA